MSQLRSQGLFPPRPPSQGKDPGNDNEVANVENKFWSSYETLDCSDEKKLMMKFYLAVFGIMIISLNFEIYILDSPREIVSCVIFDNFLNL